MNRSANSRNKKRTKQTNSDAQGVCRTYNACVLDANALPNDVEVLKRLLLEREATLASRELTIREKDRHIEHLKFQLARLRRWKFGQASEALESAGQITLSLEEIAAAVSQTLNPTGDATPAAPRQEKGKPIRRKQFPEHFERIDNVIEPGMCACPDCGGAMSELGYPDTAEVLEAKTVTFTVTRHIRPKKRCSSAQPSSRPRRRRARSSGALPAPRYSR